MSRRLCETWEQSSHAKARSVGSQQCSCRDGRLARPAARISGPQCSCRISTLSPTTRPLKHCIGTRPPVGCPILSRSFRERVGFHSSQPLEIFVLLSSNPRTELPIRFPQIYFTRCDI